MNNPVDEIFDHFIQHRPQLEQSIDELKCELSHYQGIALYGAGSSGIAFLLALRKADIHPLCFLDAAPEKWGTVCMGLPVLPPEELIQNFGENILVVVCINTDGSLYCRSFGEALRAGGHTGVHQRLKACGCQAVVDYIAFRRCFHLFHGDDTGNLPSCPDIDCMLKNRERIKRIYGCLEDEESRETYLNILSFRLMQERNEIQTLPQELQYFPQELFCLSNQERFVDCGAFNGLILHSVLQQTGNRLDAYYALEPDADNYQAFTQFVDELPTAIRDKVHTVPYAAWNDEKGISLYPLHGPGSFVAPYGGKVVKTITIDRLLNGKRATAIKMNIEGSELNALAGAKDTIHHWHPKLMIAGYHKTWDFWEVPEAILNMGEGSYKLYLRSYMHHLSFVFYGIP